MDTKMDRIWRANRWYDDLERTNPTFRFLYFMAGVMALLSVPILVQVFTDYESPWLSMAPHGIMLVLILMRLRWFKLPANKDTK
jgi:hypothetical protein